MFSDLQWEKALNNGLCISLAKLIWNNTIWK